MLLSSCAKQNAPIIKQVYHDLTGHYNTYFNANETYKLAIANIEQNRLENYDTILPIYAYGTLDDTQGMSGEFQKTIEKAELLVQTHQQKQANKNYKKNDDNTITNWGDDAFLIMAKSYYMMGEYEKGINSLKYITAYFPVNVDARTKDKIKKDRNNKKLKAKAKKEEKKLIQKEKKGEDIRPSKKLFLHEGANSEALLWLAKTYTAQEKYTEADAIFTYINSDKKFYKNYDNEVAIAKADYYLRQGNADSTIPALEKALQNKNKKKYQSRYQYVLAQLYQHNGNSSKAAEYYEASSKGNPNFEMVFYAKFNLAKMSRTGDYKKEQGERLLAKLIKDNKNKEFLDQLYYEKALFALDANDRHEAKNLLKKSTEKSISNNIQKAKSFVLLGQLFYEEENYVNAQAYYDSSLTLIDANYKDYPIIYKRSTVLTELVEYLTTINLNDSLLTLAAMPQKQREDFLYKLAVDIVEQEEKDSQQLLAGVSTPASSGKGSKTSWYFYNETTKGAGFKKFKQKWGDRELADNWRRSDKGSGDFASSGDGDSEETKGDFFAKIDAKYAEMLASIPETKEEKENLTQQIISAYYGAAITYKIGLDNEPKSVQTFEELLKRFPQNKYEPESFYNLYLLYTPSNKTKADKYKNLILEKYPNSQFAEILKDPNYLENQKNKDQALIAYYESTYKLYHENQFEEVIERSESVKEIYPNNHLQPKFDLLKALAVGNEKEYDDYVASLNYVVTTHSNTEEQAKASEILAYLKGDYPKSIPDEIDLKKGNIKINNSEQLDKIKTLKQGTDLVEEETKKGGLKLKLGEKELQIGGKENEE